MLIRFSVWRESFGPKVGNGFGGKAGHSENLQENVGGS